MNFSESRFKVVAHRGYASKYPENTLIALQEAVNVGAKMVEFDVQLTKDGVPVMLHDENFKRTTGLNLSVFEINSKELDSKVELKNVSRLDDVMVWAKNNPEIITFVELKQESITFHGLEKCVAALRASCDTALSQCVFISFNPDSVKMAQDLGFEKTGWVLLSYDEVGESISRKLKIEYLFADEEILPQGEENLWKGDWEWVIYEVVSKEVANKLYDRGATIVESKEIEKMLS
ncbi:MAG: hypothetical protein COA49_02695 [Bacteroidetes bacterium]|nr:MAG: hypothetical protein COA49_02695 [Bacteroidota bacterium]